MDRHVLLKILILSALLFLLFFSLFLFIVDDECYYSVSIGVTLIFMKCKYAKSSN